MALVLDNYDSFSYNLVTCPSAAGRAIAIAVAAQRAIYGNMVEAFEALAIRVN